MACMEHLCICCGHLEFNNISYMTEPCPKCGSVRWASSCDEELPIHQEEDEEEQNGQD